MIAVWLIIFAALGVMIHAYGYIDNARQTDVIVVLGAGLRRDNTPTATLRTRSSRAADLWHQGIAPRVICTGAVPRLATISEAEGCRQVLLAAGVPDEAILLENRSRSTEENALYTAELMQANNWNSAVIVSSRYHLFRANWLFNRLGIEAYTSPANVSFMRTPEYIRLVTREIAALHWQVFIDVFHLPITSAPLV